MADAKSYAEWIVNNQDKRGTPEFAKVAEAYELSKSVDPAGIEFQKREKTIDDFSAIERFKYEWDRSETFTENAGILLEAMLPVGNIFAGETGHGFYASPTELYGDDFLDLSVNERRERIQQVRSEKERQEYPVLSRLAEQEGTGLAGFSGAFLKALADPTTLLPVGKTPKAMAAIGGLIGGGFEATRGLAEEGRIDPLMTAATAVGGAVLAPAIDKAVRSIRPGYEALRGSVNAATKPARQKSANQVVDTLNSKIMQLQEEGVNDSNLLLAATERLGLDSNKVIKAIGEASEVIDIPERELNKAVYELKNAFEKNRGSMSSLYNDFVVTMSQRLKSLDEGLWGRVKKLEYNLKTNSAEFTNRIAGFAELERNLPRAARTEFTKRLYNGDYKGAEQLALDNGIERVTVKSADNSRYTNTVNETLNDVKSVLRDVHAYTQDAVGYDVPYLSEREYFSRRVIDAAGIRRYFGLQEDSVLLKGMYARKAQTLGKEVSELTEAQKQNVLENYLAGSNKYLPKGKPGAFKARKIDDVDDELMKYYSNSATDSLVNYIDKAVDHVEKYKFFDRGGVLPKNKNGELNFESSIGAYVKGLQDNLTLTERGAEEVKTLLNARFGAGEQSPAKFLQRMRSVSNIILLGNPISAATQLGDLFVNAYRYGGRNAFKGALETITGKNVTNVADFNLENHISQDFHNVSALGGALDFVFKRSGFRAVDRFGKNSLLQSAWNKNTFLAKSEKGIKKLKEEWGGMFGNEFDSLVNDLSAGKVSENAKLLLFTELTGSQPVTLSDMPLKYLQAPNGRIFYSLKSFGLKQLELINNTIINQARQGKYAAAGKNALAYSAIVGLGNATVQESKNWMQGREFQIDRVPDNWANYMLATAMTSRYSVDKNLKNGDIVGVISDSVAPPISVFSNLTKDVFGTMGAMYEGQDLDPKALRSVPIIGRWFYNLFGGGAEEFLERQD
jgi:hypothetical protein